MKNICAFKKKFFLFFVFVFILTGSRPIIASAGTVDDKLAQIQKMYPNGSYFTVNGQPCTSHGSYGTCNNCELTHILQARHPEMYGKLTGQAWTCLAFAKFSFYYLFGHTASTNVKQVSLAEARPGDFVSFMDANGNEKHYAIMIDSKNKIVMDGNYSKLCIVTHYNSGPFKQYPRYEILRSLNYDKVNNSGRPSDTTKPTITNAKVTNITKDGYTVTCTVSDNVGVTKVSMPTWTISNGQDDLIWHIATISGSTATYTVKRTDHKNEGGTYVTDIYADDAAGNSSIVRVSATLPNQLPTGKITSVEPYEYGYFFSYSGTATDIDDQSQSVKIEVYKVEENGSETLLGTTKTNASNHTFASYIYPEVHGNQTIHIYAIDVQTGAKVSLGTKSFYLKKGIKSISFSSSTIDVECGKSTTVMINTSPIDADEPLELGGGKPFVEASLNGKKLTIKGLAKGSTWIRVIGSWDRQSNIITINVTEEHKYITVVEKKATCNTAGSSYEQCSICGEKKANSEKTIPATGKHSYITVTTAEPTCGAAGEKCEKCAICGAIKAGSRISIPATDMHKFGDWVQTKQPTTANDGIKARRCSICGKTETASIAKLTSSQANTKNSVIKTSEVEELNKTAKTSAGVDELEHPLSKTAKTSVKTLKIKLNAKKTATLQEGQKLKIKVAGILKKKKVTFKSSNKKIATVNSKGIIKGKRAGKVTITVKCGKEETKITLKVKK